ncbi:hypothetical protein PHO31112_03285 [Pandoraea horticolens]|uniref:Uncharacterized protein n=1 Tax=Pandoraea horticolens TaxID=2508298 RepID=A0A5E4WHF6_9BURK|nr:hypothetical protein PHO31112_03285 [Pandoraea horticolens]
MVSLWGKIADWVLGTKVEAAKVALFRLAHADTLAQQLSSFSELKQYVAPARQDSLTWQISDSDSPVFRIGDFDIPCHAATENTMANLPPFDLDDRCRLLCSMHYDGQNVVSEYHHFAAETLSLPESERNADAVLAAQERFVSLTPSLLRSLKLIGLDQNDVQGDFGRDISQTVERMVSQMTGDEDTAVRAARNAENLSIFASNIMREVNAPDTSISRSDAAQTHGREPVPAGNSLAALRLRAEYSRESMPRSDATLDLLTHLFKAGNVLADIQLRAKNSREGMSLSDATLEMIADLFKAGELREANFVYTVFADRYPGNARRVASVVPAKVLHHYWAGHLDYDYLGGKRVTTWQTQNPKWADDGVEALLAGTLDTWAERALAEIHRTAV